MSASSTWPSSAKWSSRPSLARITLPSRGSRVEAPNKVTPYQLQLERTPSGLPSIVLLHGRRQKGHVYCSLDEQIPHEARHLVESSSTNAAHLKPPERVGRALAEPRVDAARSSWVPQVLAFPYEHFSAATYVIEVSFMPPFHLKTDSPLQGSRGSV